MHSGNGAISLEIRRIWPNQMAGWSQVMLRWGQSQRTQCCDGIHCDWGDAAVAVEIVMVWWNSVMILFFLCYVESGMFVCVGQWNLTVLQLNWYDIWYVFILIIVVTWSVYGSKFCIISLTRSHTVHYWSFGILCSFSFSRVAVYYMFSFFSHWIYFCKTGMQCDEF